MANARVFVVVWGGVVVNVEVPADGCSDGTHSVIDWDAIDVDPMHEWAAMDTVDREYVRREYPNEWAAHFKAVDVREAASGD